VTGSATGEVSRLLKDWGEGDESALNKLIPLVYEELRKMTHSPTSAGTKRTNTSAMV